MCNHRISRAEPPSKVMMSPRHWMQMPTTQGQPTRSWDADVGKRAPLGAGVIDQDVGGRHGVAPAFTRSERRLKGRP